MTISAVRGTFSHWWFTFTSILLQSAQWRTRLHFLLTVSRQARWRTVRAAGLRSWHSSKDYVFFFCTSKKMSDLHRTWFLIFCVAAWSPVRPHNLHPSPVFCPRLLCLSPWQWVSVLPSNICLSVSDWSSHSGSCRLLVSPQNLFCP